MGYKKERLMIFKLGLFAFLNWVHTFGFSSWMAFAGIQHGLFLLDLCE